jgi:hypothetical protein
MLEAWAVANKKDAAKDSLLYWSFKGPAIAVSSSAVLIASLESPTFSKVSAAVVAMLVTMDGLVKPGRLREVHHLAYSELRNLQQRCYSKWLSRPTAEESETAARRIIAEAQAERERIAKYVQKGETASAA